MPSTDEIVVRFKTEGGDTVEEAFRRIGSASDGFHQKVTKAGGAIGDLRLKTEGRVAANIGAIAQSMASGANAGELLAVAVTRVSESFRGSLLFAGAATAGLGLYQAITRAGEAVIKLNEDLATLRRDSHLGSDFIGADQITKNLDAANTRIDQLIRFSAQLKAVNETTSRFTPLAALNPLAAIGIGAGAAAGAIRGPVEKKIEDFQKVGTATLNQLADKQRTLNAIELEGLQGDERKAAIEKSRVAFREQEEKLALSGSRLGFRAAGPALRELFSNQDRIEKGLNKQFDLKENQLRLDQRIVDVQKELLPVGEENLKILAVRIQSLREILRLDLTNQQRAQFSGQLGGAEAQLLRAQFTAYQRGYNPGAFAFERTVSSQQRNDFEFFRNRYKQDEINRTLYPDLDKRSALLREYQNSIFGDAKGGGVAGDIAAIRSSIERFGTQLAVQ